MSPQPKPKGRGLALIEALKRRQAEQEAAARASTLTSQPLEIIHEEAAPPSNPGKSGTSSSKIEQIAAGDLGRPIDLHVNFIRLESVNEDLSFFEYKVRFDDKTDLFVDRKIIVQSHPEVPSNAHFFNGSTLIIPRQLDQLYLECQREGSTRKISFDLVGKLELTDEKNIKIYNMILNMSFRSMKLYPDRKKAGIRGGRSYFDPSERKTLVQDKIEIWPGYITNVSVYDQGVLIGFDSCSKIIRQETVKDQLTNLHAKFGSDNFINAAQKELIGASVFTRFTNRTYKIREIAMDKTPEFSFPLRNGSSMTIFEYHKDMYGIEIQDRKQPLLVAEVKQFPEAFGVEVEILLVPELCFICGLTENQRNDYKVMKRVADFTRPTPTIRREYFDNFVKALLGNREAVQHWSAWGLKINGDPMIIKGRTLPAPALYWGNFYRETIIRADWSRAASSKMMLAPPKSMEKWVIIYPKRADSLYQSFKNGLKASAQKIGISLKPPKEFKLENEKDDILLSKIRQIPQGAELVVTILSGQQRSDRYAAIKKVCCIEKPMASQVIMEKTLKNPAKLQSVCIKVLLQMATKCGGEPWGTCFPLPLVMVIGIEESKSYTSFVASTNSTFSRFYSRVIDLKLNNASLESLALQAIEAFQQENDGKTPENCIIYCNSNFQNGQFQELPIENLALIQVQKRNHVKLMQKQANEYKNPPAGTILDHSLTTGNEFYLVPMNLNYGTVTPTKFCIKDIKGSLSANQLQSVSYGLTHMYFNWTGTVKVPAPCQYALKLSDLVNSYLHSAPSETLSQTLFYL